MSITLAIVILTCLISVSAFTNNRLLEDLLFYPPAIAERRQYYRFITHGLVHADFIHLAFNMIALYSFGEALEKQLFSSSCLFGPLGKLFFLLLYIGGLIAASIPDFIKHGRHYHYRSLGASGAVSAVIFSAIVLIPKIPIGFIFIPVDIPGYIFGLAYLLISAFLDKKGGSNINHGAHFWGAIFGLLFTILSITAFGKINVWENFIRQLQASQPFLPACY